MKNNDLVSHPLHYTDGRKYEPKDVIRDWGLNFNLGSAVKYISRAGRKGDKIQDLEKARQFLTFEIEALEEEEKNAEYWPEKYDIHLNIPPTNVNDAVLILREELMKHGDLYNAFLASMISVIDEEEKWKLHEFTEEITKKMLKRVIGEE